MAFFKIKADDRMNLPAGAVEIRRDKVAGFYTVVVETWERPSEIWALRYGPMVLGAAGAFNGWYGNLYFRKKLRLKTFGFVSTYIPNIILPFLITQTLHTTVTINILPPVHASSVLKFNFWFHSLCSPTYSQIHSVAVCAKKQGRLHISWLLVCFNPCSLCHCRHLCLQRDILPTVFRLRSTIVAISSNSAPNCTHRWRCPWP